MMACLFLLAVTPFGEGASWVRAGLLSTVLVAGVWSASGIRFHRIVGIALGAPALVLTWIGRQETGVLGAWSATAVAVFFAYIIGTVLVRLVRTRTVTAHTIWAGICVYMLIPILWTRLFAILIHVSETPSTVFRGLGAGDWMSQLSYYSFVTLTTLGFGDITPLTVAARRLTTVEAVIGQLFLAIFIARLVGLHLAERMEKRDSATP